MSQLLTLSRAARLVGVTRGILQKAIQNGQLSTFEGKVAITDLLRAYPNTKMEDTTMLERVEQIKVAAKPGQRQEETSLPSSEVLFSRLSTLGQELSITKSELQRYLELVDTLKQKLHDLAKIDEVDLRSRIQTLSDWLTTEIQRHLPKKMDPVTQLQAKDTILRIMAAHVKIIPSGHEFFVEGNDSILDAALRAGLALNYGCAGGNCGLCKARLVSGEVQKIGHHDYVISETEKQMGYKLMCSYTAVTDIVLEAAEAHSTADIPLQQIGAKVKKLESVNNDLLVLYLQTPRTQTLRFLAGQQVTLSLEEGVSADYFIASCPCDGRNLEFHLHRIFDNPFTEAVFNTVKKGQVVNIEGPKGNFILQEDSTRPSLFLAYAHGFAPIKSLIEHAIALDTVPSFHFYWIASPENGHYQNNWCRARTDALDNFRYTPLTADANNESEFQSALAQLVNDYPDLNNFEVYISVPQNRLTTVETILRQHHLPENQLHLGENI